MSEITLGGVPLSQLDAEGLRKVHETGAAHCAHMDASGMGLMALTMKRLYDLGYRITIGIEPIPPEDL